MRPLSIRRSIWLQSIYSMRAFLESRVFSWNSFRWIFAVESCRLPVLRSRGPALILWAMALGAGINPDVPPVGLGQTPSVLGGQEVGGKKKEKGGFREIRRFPPGITPPRHNAVIPLRMSLNNHIPLWCHITVTIG
jgi:hypothetical protein